MSKLRSKRPRRSNDSLKYVAFRLVFLCGLCLLLAFGLYFFAGHLNDSRSGMVTLTALFSIPYLIGVVVAYFTEIWRTGRALMSSLFVLVMVHIIGGLVLREGVICIAMVAIIWYPCVLLGAATVSFLFNRYDVGRLNSTPLLLLPIMFLMMDATMPITTQSHRVVREVIINASAETVWSNLHNIRDITETDGRWNITQDILNIPRPVAAVTHVRGEADVRTNVWAKSIAFEEHITQTVINNRLHWRFIFPDDSIKHKTDRHLDPDSHYFTIETGGFDLEAIGENKTRLKLHTQYRIATPVNGYGALWGEFLLGDIQNNVLSIIQTRSEALKAAGA